MSHEIAFDEDNPEPLVICDRTGFMFLKSQTAKQMEYRGDALVWTGLIVGKAYLDMPDPLNRIPTFTKLGPDPRPQLNVRPDDLADIVTWSNIDDQWRTILDYWEQWPYAEQVED